MRRSWIAFALLSAAPPARARDHGGRVQIEALTSFPTQAGVGAVVEAPGGLRFTTSIGVLPSAYVDFINGTATAFGAYDQDAANLVNSVLSSSLVWQAHGGWRPAADSPFYLDVGYGLVTLGGDTTTEDVLTVATGRPVRVAGGGHYKIDSTLHMIDIVLGLQFDLTPRWVMRTGIGGAFTLSSKTTVEPPPASDPHIERAQKAYARETGAWLDDLFGSYVHTPTLTLAFGYRLF